MNKGSRYIHTVTCLPVFYELLRASSCGVAVHFAGRCLKFTPRPHGSSTRPGHFAAVAAEAGPRAISSSSLFCFFSPIFIFVFSGRCRRFIPATVPFGFIPGDPVSCAPLTPSPFQGAAIMFPFLFWSILEPRLSHPPVAFRLRPVVLVLVSRQYCLMAPRTLPA